MSKGDNILIATDISREFQAPDGNLPVLTGISLQIKRKEMIAVTGASGVGKSTLLHILGGLDKPTSGEIEINGQSLNQKSQEYLARFRNKHVGFVFQHHYLLDDFTALENVMLPILVAGKSRSDAKQKGELLLDQVGLSNRSSHLPKQLSGGEQQRIAVARALANEPDIVLADEPSGNLDTATGRRLHDLLLKLNEEGTSIVVATHNRELAGECHREVEIVNGKLSDCAN